MAGRGVVKTVVIAHRYGELLSITHSLPQAHRSQCLWDWYVSIALSSSRYKDAPGRI